MNALAAFMATTAIVVMAPAPAPDYAGTAAVAVKPTPTSARWSRLVASIDASAESGLSEYEQVLSAQERISALVEIDKTSPCTDDGYWAPVMETVRRGKGDCTDVAVAKMELLRASGIQPESLYLTTGKNEHGQVEYALLVHNREGAWLLTRHGVENAKESRKITPIITYGVNATYVHGYRQDKN